MRGGTIPIRRVAQMTGISADRLRIWERRYRALQPARNSRGRSYTQGDVERILLLREVLQCGHSIGRVASLSDRELRSLLAQASQSRDPQAAHKREAADEAAVAPLLNAVKEFDYGRAERELNRMAVLLGSPRRLVHLVVLPLMRAVGRHWEKGVLSVAQEHMVTVLLSNFLGSVLRASSADGHGTKLLFATLPEERHFFGTLAAALVAASGGLDALCLGGDLPPEEILFAAKKTRSDVVVVAAYESWPTERYQSLELLARQMPRNTQLWMGGPICVQLIRSLNLRTALPLPDFYTLEKHLSKLGARF